MAAAHQRLRTLLAIRDPTRKDPRAPRGRRGAPIRPVRLIDKLAARRIPDPRDPAAVATELMVTAALLERAFRAELRHSAVNDLDAARALLVISTRHVTLRPGDVAELLAVSPSTATRIVDRLDAAGLVDRNYANVDRRTVRVELTPNGERARREVLARLGDAARTVLGGHTTGLAEPLAATGRSWRRRPSGFGLRLARDWRLTA